MGIEELRALMGHSHIQNYISKTNELTVSQNAQ